IRTRGRTSFQGSATRMLMTGSVPITSCETRKKGLNAKRLHITIIHMEFKRRPCEVDWGKSGLHILLMFTPFHVLARGNVSRGSRQLRVQQYPVTSQPRSTSPWQRSLKCTALI